MQSDSSRFFVLKFGGPIGSNHSIEVRNDRFELLGTCHSQNIAHISGLMSQQGVSQQVREQLMTMEHGKITMVTL
jgi:hypothetical protein